MSAHLARCSALCVDAGGSYSAGIAVVRFTAAWVAARSALENSSDLARSDGLRF